MSKQIEIVDHGRGTFVVSIPYGCECSNDFARQLRDRLIKLTSKRANDSRPTPRISKISLNIP